jgi:hypothetical protein
MPAASDRDRLNALTSSAGNAFNVEYRKRRTAYCSGRAGGSEPRLPDVGGDLPGTRVNAMSARANLRKGALLESGTPSPNPWDLPLSRQNVRSTLKAPERRIGLRRDATRAPIQGPECQGAGFHSRPQNSNPRPRRALAYCGQDIALTMLFTLGCLDKSQVRRLATRRPPAQLPSRA